VPPLGTKPGAREAARQRRALRSLQAQRPDARKPLFDALQTLDAIATTLLSYTASADATTDTLPGLDRLRGHEGAAARAYFAGLGRGHACSAAIYRAQPPPAA
jgi:CRISPR-associated protein Cas1